MVKVKKERILIKPEDIKPSSDKLEVIGTYNPGAIRAKNGDIVLLVRVAEKLIKNEDRKYSYVPRLAGKNKYYLVIDKFGKNIIEYSSDLDILFKDHTKRLKFISHIRKVILDKTGFKVKSIDSKPTFFGTCDDGELGVEDPRITKLGNKYYMTYVSLSRKDNITTSLAVSNDLNKWTRKGIIFGEQDKDVVIFPEKIKNQYMAFDRPESSFKFSPPHIWVAYSNDLISWGKLESLNLSRKGEWDYVRVGAGPPPLKTNKGWLLIYHIVLEPRKKAVVEYIIDRMEIRDNISGKFSFNESVYCVGAALLDLKNPEKVIAKAEVPILFPMKKYEIGGYEAKRVIFPTGIITDKNKKDILLFSGTGDRFTTVKKLSLNKILKKLDVMRGQKFAREL